MPSSVSTLTSSIGCFFPLSIVMCSSDLTTKSRSVMSDSLRPVDCSPSGPSVHGILQAKVLEWVAISFSRESSWPRDWTQVSRIAGRLFNLWATREALVGFSSDLTSLEIKINLSQVTNSSPSTFLSNYILVSHFTHCFILWSIFYQRTEMSLKPHPFLTTSGSLQHLRL